MNRASIQQSIEDMEKEIKAEEPKIQKEEEALRESVASGKADRNAAYRVFMRKQILEEKKSLLSTYIEQESEFERLCFNLGLQREKLQMKKGEVALNVSLGKTFTVDIEADEFLREIKINTKGKAEAAKILSNGEKIQAPKPLKANLKKLRRLSKSLSRKQKDSSNRAKAKTKLSRLHYKISCIRKDFLHRLTSRLVSEFDTICIEDLSVKDMLKDKRLSRVISDLGFYEFKRQLIYKADAQGKVIKELDRFYPSSKTCSCCGFKLESLSLSTRAWTCPNCKINHDRDVNASLNILNNAKRVLTIH